MNRSLAVLAVLLFVTASSAVSQPGGPGGPGGGGSQGDGIWRRNAYFGEAQTFDSCYAHQPGTGDNHYHANPTCLRYQLGDNITLVKTLRTGPVFAESTKHTHSKILGWAYDGFPIYGPYGYSTATDSKSPARRLTSSYRLRNITKRTTLPTWALPNHSGIS